MYRSCHVLIYVGSNDVIWFMCISVCVCVCVQIVLFSILITRYYSSLTNAASGFSLLMMVLIELAVGRGMISVIVR